MHFNPPLNAGVLSNARQIVRYESAALIPRAHGYFRSVEKKN